MIVISITKDAVGIVFYFTFWIAVRRFGSVPGAGTQACGYCKRTMKGSGAELAAK